MLSHLIIAISSMAIASLTLFSGFGLGTLLMPIFALFFSMEVAIGATAIVHLFNNVVKLLLVGRTAHFLTVVNFSLPAAFAAIIGAMVLFYIGQIPVIFSYELFGKVFPIEPLKLSIGLVLMFFSIMELYPKINRIEIPSRMMPLGGLLSGFFGGLSGIQGALRSMFLIRANLSKEQFIGTAVVSSVLVDCSRLIVYSSKMSVQSLPDFQQDGKLGLLVTGTVSAILGSVFASKLIKKVTLESIQTLVGTSLLLVGIGLCVGLI